MGSQGPTLLDDLARGSYRLTGPRRQVAALIGARAGSFTAADLMADARRRGMRIGRATVFRALDTFSELGALERLELDGGDHAYVVCGPRSEHHHHVVCRSCGRASEIIGCDVEPWAQQVQRATGYEVDRHRIELYGICPRCQSLRA